MDLKLDDSGDLDLTDGVTWIEGDDAIRQHVAVSLRLFKGDWFLNTNEGVPYVQDIFGKVRNLNAVSNLLRRAVLKVPGVVKVDKLELDLDAEARTLGVNFAATLESGTVLTFEEFIL